MRETLCRHLCCPECRSDLELRRGELDGDEIMTGSLSCPDCRKDYPIVGGVARFVGEDLSGALRRTARNFGTSWKIWCEIDDDRYRKQMMAWLPALEPEDYRDKTLLDTGCGKGRHLRIVAGFGAREVIGVDLSDAVDLAWANTRDLPHVHVVQADLHRLPLKGNFDLAYSIGVLHHTPDPQHSFRSMLNQVRPGGTVACWVYGRENNGWIVWLVNPVRLLITRRLPAWILRGLARVLAAVLFLLIHAVYVPAGALGVRLFYRDYMLNLRELGFAECRHIVYDHLVAPTAFYLRRNDVKKWFDVAGLARQSITWVNRNSWSGTACRPALP
ncbi:MAG: methyltransferase domain-containing protein [Planctomycetota bacterium]|jgi:SAM-dependent methyltransferase